MSKVRVRLGNSTSDLLQELVERGVEMDVRVYCSSENDFLVCDAKKGCVYGHAHRVSATNAEEIGKALEKTRAKSGWRAEQRKRLEEMLYEMLYE